MGSKFPTTRSANSRHRVRYANERRTRRPEGRVPRLTPPAVRFSKDGLFSFYVLIFLGPLFLVVAGFIAFFAHDVALPAFVDFVAHSVRSGVTQMWSRPTLVIAFLFVLSVVWCFSGGSTTYSSRNFRRGRDVGSLNHAQKLARDHSTKHRHVQSRRRN